MHAVADGEPSHVGAGLDHDAGGLVAEHHRLAHDERPDRAVVDVVQIAAAHADDARFDAHVRRGEFFVDWERFDTEGEVGVEDEGVEWGGGHVSHPFLTTTTSHTNHTATGTHSAMCGSRNRK